MISVLFAALCISYDASGACVDRQVFPAGSWEGPEAPIECAIEENESRQRLEQAGLEQHFLLYCESQSAGE